MAARIFNILLGIWLFISVFFWEHSSSQSMNAMIVGVLAISFAALAIMQPGTRWLNMALGGWLFFSAWILPTSNPKSVWNDAICGIVMLAVAAIPSRRPSGEDSGYFGKPRREVHV